MNSFPEARAFEASASDVIRWLPTLTPCIEEFIRHVNEKAKSVYSRVSRNAHSPGVLRYLEQELGITLPDPDYSKALPTDNGSEDKLEKDIVEKTPLNTILYDPPGTGKIFTTAARAVEIVTGQKPPEDRDTLMEIYREKQRAGQIRFVTFHQSYAYEDFIEGIRPVLSETGSSGPRYKLVDGILKEIALNALATALVPVTASPGNTPSFAQLWHALTVTEDGAIWVGDAKYKHLAAGQSHSLFFREMANSRLSSDDVRQLTVYAELYQRQYGNRPQIALLYPFVGEPEAAEADVATAWSDSRFWLVPVLLNSRRSLTEVLPANWGGVTLALRVR